MLISTALTVTHWTHSEQTGLDMNHNINGYITNARERGFQTPFTQKYCIISFNEEIGPGSLYLS
jgi:hypothetical protein